MEEASCLRRTVSSIRQQHSSLEPWLLEEEDVSNAAAPRSSVSCLPSALDVSLESLSGGGGEDAEDAEDEDAEEEETEPPAWLSLIGSTLLDPAAAAAAAAADAPWRRCW